MDRNAVDDFLKESKLFGYESISTGIDLLDHAIGGGLIRGSLVLLEGGPGVGKTALATQIFENIAKAKNGNSTLYFNLEMSRNQLIARSLSRIMYLRDETEMSAIEVLRRYRHTAKQGMAVASAASAYQKDIADGITYNSNGTEKNLDEILSYIEAEATRKEETGKHAPFVVIDSLQQVIGMARESQETVMKHAAYCLKSYAIQHNSIVFVTAGRNVGRDAPVLECSADLHIQLERKEEVLPEVITLDVIKNRFGESSVGKGRWIHFAFLGGQSLFIPLDQWKARCAAKGCLEGRFEISPFTGRRVSEGEKWEQELLKMWWK